MLTHVMLWDISPSSLENFFGAIGPRVAGEPQRTDIVLRSKVRAKAHVLVAAGQSA
jgi:hypothetical protein